MRAKITQDYGAMRRKRLLGYAYEPHNMKQAIMDALSCIPKNQQTTVLLSAGMDSHAAFFAALDLGLKLNIASVTLGDRKSSDFLAAKHSAKVFGLDFEPIILPTGIDHLKRYLLWAVKKFGFKSKIALEASWALSIAFYHLSNVGTKHILTGLCGGVYFALGKTATMHYKDVLYEFKLATFRADNLGYLRDYARYCFELGMTLHDPFASARVYAEFQNLNEWDILNKPRQKYPYREPWLDYLRLCKTKNAQNFHLADSGIAEHFSKLLDTDWNTRNCKSVKGIYNDLASGRISRINL